MTRPPVGSQRYGHVHAEAFALMQYECARARETRFGVSADGCGTVEWVWNSRDGVTPFGIDCRACGSGATHVRLHEDLYAPDRVPQPGERIFVDLTEERAHEAGRHNAERFWNDPAIPAARDGRWRTVEEMAEDLTRGYLEGVATQQPDLIVVPTPPPPEPRGYYCVVHGAEHRADWPWEYEECRSERDVAIEDAYVPPPFLGAPLRGLDRLRARWRCWRAGSHAWFDNGSTLGGIWLRCVRCDSTEEFLPGVHEPEGGEAVWQARLDRAGVRR